jgi:uncharacterized protein (UPF0147 family)
MGANSSIPSNIINTIYSETVNNLLVDTKSVCNNQNNITQTINLSNIETINCDTSSFSNISNKVEASITNECIQNNDLGPIFEKAKSEFLNKIADSPSIPPTTRVDITNVVNNKLSVDSLLSCLNNTNISQSILLNKLKVRCADGGKFSVDEVSNYVHADIVSKCIQGETELVEGIKEVTKELPKDTDSSKGITTEMTAGIVVGVIVLLILIILGAVGLFKYLKR